MGALYVVATPIGNLGDITARALETLRKVDRIVAEDTRRTRQLLNHFGIDSKQVDRVDEHASAATIEAFAERVIAGEEIALVTDAGTPVVSDPGTALVEAVARRGGVVLPIPGASAAIAALSASGLVASGFRFVGFLPRGGPERRERLELVRDTPEPVILFESPERIADTLKELATPQPARRAVVARELTKMHEELVRGTLDDLAKLEREWIGEITVVVGERLATEAPKLDDAAIDRRIDEELGKGRRAKDIAEQLALELDQPKRELYARVIARKPR